MRANLLLLIFLLCGSVAFAAPSTPAVTVHFTVQTNSIIWDRSHTLVMFLCKVVIDNQTTNTVASPNPFQERVGLGMNVMDNYGRELTRLYCGPFHVSAANIGPGSSQVFWPYYGPLRPGSNKTVRLQLGGELIGSSYTRPITSDIVNLQLQK